MFTNKDVAKEKILTTFNELQGLIKEPIDKGVERDNICGRANSDGEYIITPNVRYQALYTKIVTQIFEYSKLIFTNEKARSNFQSAGVQVMSTIRRCIWSYEGNKGDFVRYVMVAVSKEVKRAALKDEKDGLPCDCVESGDSDKTVFMVDLCKDEKEDFIDKDDVLDIKSNITTLFSIIDRVYSNEQERTKRFASALLTRQVLEELFYVPSFDVNFIKSVCQGYKFIDEDILNQYLCSERFEQNDIALRFNKDKTDASRLVKKLVDKIKCVFEYNNAC